MKNSYPVVFACLVTGPGNCQCLSLGDGRKKLEAGVVRSSIRFSTSWSMEHVHRQTKKTFCNQLKYHHLDGQERTWEQSCIINNIIISSSSSSLLFTLLHYSKKVYSYISLGPIFEGNDETIGIIGITGHVQLYLFSI